MDIPVRRISVLALLVDTRQCLWSQSHHRSPTSLSPSPSKSKERDMSRIIRHRAAIRVRPPQTVSPGSQRPAEFKTLTSNNTAGFRAAVRAESISGFQSGITRRTVDRLGLLQRLCWVGNSGTVEQCWPSVESTPAIGSLTQSIGQLAEPRLAAPPTNSMHRFPPV